MSRFTRCDTCKKTFEAMDEYVSKQSVAIKIAVKTGRRAFPCEFRDGDFCSTKCAIAWLTAMNKETSY